MSIQIVSMTLLTRNSIESTDYTMHVGMQASCTAIGHRAGKILNTPFALCGWNASSNTDTGHHWNLNRSKTVHTHTCTHTREYRLTESSP